MKQKLLFTILLIALFCFALSFSIFASSTNEFGEVESINGIDLTGMNSDTRARIVVVDSDGTTYHTYPACYVVTDNTKFTYDFTRIQKANGVTYTKNSIVRIEVPDNILIAPNCGALSQTSNMIEIKFSPDSQLTTLEYGCFYANKKLVKLNIPKNVTTIGTLIINNCSALSELTFDDGFSAYLPTDSFIGATNVKKIVFSNQMTTIDKKAFFSTFTNLREIYAGENLIDFGAAAPVDGVASQGGNFSYCDGPVKIYASSKLFADIDTIERGRLNGWTGNRLLKGVIFYTGTKDQAQELIDKAESNTPIFNSATLVEWDSSVSDDDYVPSSGWKIVYGYNKCKAFYGGEHKISDGKVIKFEAERFLSKCIVTEGCDRNCGLNTSYEELMPLFVCRGYSVSGDSMLQSFGVNRDLIEKYSQLFGEISFGLLAAGSSETLNTATGEIIFPDGTKANEKVAMVDYTKKSYDILEIKVHGLKDYGDTEIYLCGYIIVNDSVIYLNNGKAIDRASSVTLNKIK